MAGAVFHSHITANATEEVKLDGYRAIGVRTSRETVVYSVGGKNFNKRYPFIAEAIRRSGRLVSIASKLQADS
jgi:ATP-dependent DNA ligase